MQLDNKNLVDSLPVYSYYAQRGLATDLLKMCNSQEFRFIDGYGKGYFLMTHNITSEEVSFTIDSRTVNLIVTDKLSLEHPNHSGGLIVYITAEPKYKLKDIIVSRNYNITLDKSLSQYGPPTIVTMQPDNPAKTIQQVIDDILPSGYSLSYNASALTSFDIAIEGLSVLDAIDRICSAYGFIWTSTGSTVYIWDMVPVETSTDYDPINDIRRTTLFNSPTDINVAFKIYNYNRHTPDEYHIYQDNESGQGQTVNVMDPYYFAVINTLGEIRNTSVLNTRGQLIADNLRGIKSSIEFIEKHHFEAEPLSTQPISLSEIYADWGNGPRSIYRAIKYPYIHVDIPPSKPRFANNWRGTLSDGYSEVVSSFIVTPVVGLDGKIPNGPQRVYNVYGWDYGEQGAMVRVEWNPTYAQWEAIQQEYECPPDVLPEPPEEPTEPSNPWDEDFPTVDPPDPL